MRIRQTGSRLGVFVIFFLLGAAGGFPSGLQAATIDVTIGVENTSTWNNQPTNAVPPGDGSGNGQIAVGVWDGTGDALLGGAPLTSLVLRSTAALPFPAGAFYQTNTTLVLGNSYTIIAWVWGSAGGYTNQAFNIRSNGFPRSVTTYVQIGTNQSTVALTVVDDLEGDDLPDWWEKHWFGNLFQTGSGDYDADGLTNLQEYQRPGLSPLNWDTDGDTMDDAWEVSMGLNPTVNDAALDSDGDGLRNIDEYKGQDGIPPKQGSGGIAWLTLSTDDLNPRSADTDSDGLIDSFEFLYLDPKGTGDPAADSDNDGLSDYREQCLLTAFGEGGVYSNAWLQGPSYVTNINLLISPVSTSTATWTDPSTSDTDGDGLPDGWEVEFNLDPRNPNGDQGADGDPDGDGVANYWEWVNGTNPYGHNWGTESTFAGNGASRSNTLGSAAPTIGVGWDDGYDTDDDGLDDFDELDGGTSPIDPLDPAISRCALVTAPAGIAIPDHGTGNGYRPDITSTSWTLECWVLFTNAQCSGHLIDIPRPKTATNALYSYRLSLSNGIPSVSFSSASGASYPLAGYGTPLATGTWAHVAGAWDGSNLALYVNGVLATNKIIRTAGPVRPSALVSRPLLGDSANGSFANSLYLDEVRIWRTARSAVEIAGSRAVWVTGNTNLAAYYRFDDGGQSAEDFTRKAKNGLLNAVSPDYTFGDRGYALTGGFTFVATTYAPIGPQAGEDADLDGMPDWWEIHWFGDTNQTASSDFDGDGLSNLDEYRISRDFGLPGLCPTNWDTDGDGMDDEWECHWTNVSGALILNPTVADADGDADHDGVSNIIEYRGRDGQAPLRALSPTDAPGIAGANPSDTGDGLRPDAADSDDDGINDATELDVTGTSPVDSMDPHTNRSALVLSPAGLTIPHAGVTNGFRSDLPSAFWTLECWVLFTNTQCSGHLIDIPRPETATNALYSYRLSLSNGFPSVSFCTAAGTNYPLVGYTTPLVTGAWAHVAGAWDGSNLSLYVNGALATNRIIRTASPVSPAALVSRPLLGDAANGSFVNALYLDEVRIWRTARSAGEIASNRAVWVADNATNLAAYYRFDDGGRSAEDFTRKAKDGRLDSARPDYAFGDLNYAIVTGAFRFAETTYAPVSPSPGADEDLDGMPDWWELQWFGDTNQTGSDDFDGDGLSNLEEYRIAHDFGLFSLCPTNCDTDGDGMDDGWEYQWMGPTNLPTLNPTVADADGDADGDGVCNLLEYRGIDGRPPLLVLDPTNAPTIAGANPDDTGDALRPDAPDTDDDGIQDSVEWGLTRPNDPRDPPSPRWMCFGGGAGDCLVVSNAATHGLEAWTIDVWVTPSNGTAAAGTIVRSVVRKASGSSAMTNYVMGLATNGAGELVPYVGFATSTGQFTIAGGAIPAGTATHLAGTYDSVVGRLRLYVNGIETNNGISARVIPPADGVTTLIMGEGFVGALDEVRVWNSPLTVEEIADVRLHTVDPANPALVHYFRFDDGGVSAQDFKFMKDWTNRWAHAAMLKGDVHFGQGGWPSPSPLQVIVTPDRAIAAGAQWQVSTTSATNWSAWMDSRAFVWGLTTGEHRIAYQPLAGWTVPETNTVTITNDDAFVWTATYTELTGVKVQIQPAEAVTTGAQWTVDGGGWADSGGFIASIAGTHTVTFKPVDGWAHPAAMTVPVLDGSNTWLRVPYCPMTVLSTNRQFRSPRGLVVDSKRVLYVSDWENSRILLLNPATEQWETLADVGSGLGQVRQPMGLTIDTADNLYVADAGNNRIQKRTAATGQWTAWGTGQTVYPSDVAVGAGAVLFVADRGNNRVLRIAPDGACTPLLVAYELVLPSGIAIGPTGNMLVADYPASPPNSVRVQEFTAAGVFVRKWGSSSSGEGLLSASGKMYGMVFSGARVTVADTGNNRLAAATNLLVWSAVPGSGPLNAPEDLTYDGRGYLYVSDTGNNRVLLIQPPEAGAGPDVALRPRGASGASSLFDISLSAGWRWRHVEYADLLSTNTTWQLLPGYSGVDSSGSSVVITNGPGVTQRFYRVIAY